MIFSIFHESDESSEIVNLLIKNGHEAKGDHSKLRFAERVRAQQKKIRCEKDPSVKNKINFKKKFQIVRKPLNSK